MNSNEARIFEINNLDINTLENNIYPLLEPSARQELVCNYHPDYLETGKKALDIGPNRGERMAAELVELLQADYHSPHLTRTEKTDLLIIGSGAAGIAAALESQGKGKRVMLLSATNIGSSNSVLAQGGMAAAVGPDDSPELHAKDTMIGGQTNVPQLVKIMAEEGPEVIYWLDSLGLPFDRNNNGNFHLIGGAGHSRKRVLTCKGLIGPRLMKTLLKALKTSDVEVYPNQQLSGLRVNHKGNKAFCKGAYFYDHDRQEYISIESGATILATGGMGALKPYGLPTNNNATIRGEGLIAAYRAGVKLKDMNANQFHPTGVLWPPEVQGMLVSEGVRTLGAALYNREGRQFINPMETRDVVTAAILKEIIEGRGLSTTDSKVGILLGSHLLPEEILKNSLGRIFGKLKAAGYNPSKTPLIVSPVYHYQNGGIEIDENGKTTLAGLWAAGEVTGGVHGKNRLGGNALTDALVFGRRAARNTLLSL